jgi:2-polyprenyl-6-methoxyphenol hydroxylase-like FAD-dependent oxidoreductase
MTQQSPPRHRGRHAVVIGGSVAGLLAAAAVEPHFDQVTLVERDQFPTDPTFRKGVPQTRHLHLLWGHGLDLIEQLHPGVRTELLDAGALLLGLPQDVLWLGAAGWNNRFPSTHQILSCSRELLDWTLRRRLEQSAKVRLATGYEATSLTSANGWITGVRLRTRPSSATDRGGQESELAADFVVDATGRSSHLPQWLAEIGRTTPRETVVNSFLGYASRNYAMPADFSADWKLLFVQPKPPDGRRGGVLLPIEGDRWAVSLTGAGRDYPPLDEDGFLEFARSLRSPVLYQAIERAEPLTPIRGYQRTENRRRHYEKLRDLPDRLVVLGDAACALNPAYAHGMTVSAIEAHALRRGLQEGPQTARDDPVAGVSRRVQRQVAQSAKAAWLIATSSDLRYASTEGARPDPITRLVQRYLDRTLWAACGDPQLATVLLDVLNLAATPNSMLRPRVVYRTLGARTGPLQEPPLGMATVSPAPGSQSLVAER